MGRGKKYAPTEAEQKKDRTFVSACALLGMPHEEIAKVLGVSKSTLKKYYLPELKNSKQRAIANVAASLYNSAMKGNTVAQIFYLKTQAGWRETGMSEDANRPLPVVKYADRKD